MQGVYCKVAGWVVLDFVPIHTTVYIRTSRQQHYMLHVNITGLIIFLTCRQIISFDMGASTQYNDLIGTTAADRDTHDDFINSFLQTRGVDTDRFRSIGSRFYQSDSGTFSAFFICIDNEKTDGKTEHIVEIGFETDITPAEYFNLFRRYEGIVVQDHYKDHKIEDQITIDDAK